MTSETKNTPVEKIRVGSVQIAIWKNVAPESGTVYFNATTELSYKQSGEWKTSGSYGLNELVHLAKASLLAHSAILKLQAAEAKAGGPERDASAEAA